MELKNSINNLIATNQAEYVDQCNDCHKERDFCQCLNINTFHIFKKKKGIPKKFFNIQENYDNQSFYSINISEYENKN